MPQKVLHGESRLNGEVDVRIDKILDDNIIKLMCFMCNGTHRLAIADCNQQ